MRDRPSDGAARGPSGPVRARSQRGVFLCFLKCNLKIFLACGASATNQPSIGVEFISAHYPLDGDEVREDADGDETETS